MLPVENLEDRLRNAISAERDPSHLERLSSALVELLRCRVAFKDAEEGARHALEGRQRGPSANLTLHKAISQVLAERGEPMKPTEISEAVNRRKLYQRRDGGPVPSSQVSARVKNYGQLFQKLADGRIKMRKVLGDQP